MKKVKVSDDELKKVAQWLHDKRHDLQIDDTLLLITMKMEDLEDEIMSMVQP